jgi:uncharacterized membrane protein YedE/YeeE
MELLLLLLGVVLAGFAGYTAQNASICSVRAVSEVIEDRDYRLLVSFAKAALWATAVAAPLGWVVFGEIEAEMPRLTLLVLLGGFLFGIGAALNRGCAVSTVNHLASGDGVMLLTLAGLAAGSLLTVHVNGGVAAGATTPFLAIPGTLQAAIVVTTWLWTVLELRRLLLRRITGRARLLAIAAIALGLCNGILFVLQGPWAYTAAIAQSSGYAFGWNPAPHLVVLVLFLALVGGAGIAAWRSGRFRLRWQGERPWTQHLLGGVFMGAGAALVPGGNDAVLLNAIPLLAEHALPAFAAMLLGVSLVLLLQPRISFRVEQGFAALTDS